MARIFVSYSRSDISKVKRLIPLFREVYGMENVWWDQNFYGGQVWWDEIKQQIARCDVFVYLMSPRSLGSPYCLAELDEARRIHKPVLYVKLRRETRVPDAIAQTHYLQLTGRVNWTTIPPLIRSINEYASRPPSSQPPITEMPVLLPQIPPKEPRNNLADYTGQIIIAVIATIVGGVILAVIIQADRFAPTQAPITISLAAQNTTESSRLSGFQQLQTAEAESTRAAETQSAINLKVTETAAYRTLVALSATSAPTITPLPPTFTPALVATETKPATWTLPASSWTEVQNAGQSSLEPCFMEILEPATSLPVYSSPFDAAQLMGTMTTGDMIFVAGFTQESNESRQLWWLIGGRLVGWVNSIDEFSFVYDSSCSNTLFIDYSFATQPQFNGRSIMFQFLRQSIDSYNSEAKEIIDSIGR